MRLNNPRDLFIYEMSGMYDAERRIADMLNETAEQVENEKLVQMLRTHQQETQQQAENLEQCFEHMGESPLGVTAGPIEAMRTEFREFVNQEPSADVLTMFTIGSAAKIEHFEIAAYRGLMDKAMLMDDAKLVRSLESNLVQEEETAGKLERYAHELGQQMLVPA